MKASPLSLLIAALGLVALGAPPAKTNSPPKATGFSFPYRNKEDRLIALFTGADNQPLSPTLYQVRQFRVETYNPDGTPNLIGEAPECRLNLTTKSVASAGTLTLSQAGRLFSLTGEGFEWDHESGRLVLSNRVHTIIRINPLAGRSAPP